LFRLAHYPTASRKSDSCEARRGERPGALRTRGERHLEDASSSRTLVASFLRSKVSPTVVDGQPLFVYVVDRNRGAFAFQAPRDRKAKLDPRENPACPIYSARELAIPTMA
jgi:hypothetical protein